MNNVAELVPGELWVAGDPVYSHERERNKFQKMNLLVVDTRDHREARNEPGWRFIATENTLHAPMLDGYGEKTEVEHFIAFWAALQSYERQPTMIHCHMGVNRSPSAAWMVLRMRYQMAAVDAFLLIREKRPEAGLAYVRQAFEASMDIEALIPPKERRKTLKAWDAFESDYWKKKMIAGVSLAISERNDHYTTGASLWYDERGLVHGTAK